MNPSPRVLTVHVAFHRSGPHPSTADSPFVAVCNVLPDGRRPLGFQHYDDDGGLPDKNQAYCELSVLHRLHRRDRSPWVGLAHYRRVLVARPPERAAATAVPGEWRVPGWDWHDLAQHAASEQVLLQAVGDHDWCTARPYDVRRAGFRSLLEQFLANHPRVLLAAADAALAEHAAHLPSLSEHLRARRELPLYNVFVGRRPVLERYGSFLWPLLEATGSRVLATEDAYQRRWAGFLAERLHGYWLEHVGAQEGLAVGHLPVAVLADHERPAPLLARSRAAASRFLPAAAALRGHDVARVVTRHRPSAARR